MILLQHIPRDADELQQRAPGLIATSAVGALGYDTGAVFLRNNPVKIKTYGQTTHKYRKPKPRGRALDKQQCHRGVGGGRWLFRVLGRSKLRHCAGALRLSLLRRRPIDRRASFVSPGKSEEPQRGGFAISNTVGL